MQISSIFSLGLALYVLFQGVISSTDNPMRFIDPISLFIVIGGTLAATSISFKITNILNLFILAIRRFLTGRSVNNQKLVKKLLSLFSKYLKDQSAFKIDIRQIKDPFLKDSLELMLDSTISQEELMDLLEIKAKREYELHEEDAQKFRTIAKFPPAFGMMGTTIGMIAVFEKLGTANAIQTLGPSMSLCMITTLYGVALANLFIIPISENLMATALDNKLKNDIIIDTIRMMKSKSNPVIVAEKMNTFLQDRNKINWKEVVGQLT